MNICSNELWIIVDLLKEILHVLEFSLFFTIQKYFSLKVYFKNLFKYETNHFESQVSFLIYFFDVFLYTNYVRIIKQKHFYHNKNFMYRERAQPPKFQCSRSYNDKNVEEYLQRIKNRYNSTFFLLKTYNNFQE